MRNEKPLRIRLEQRDRNCRRTTLKYAKSFDDKNTPKVGVILDRIAAEFDKLAAMGVEARVSYGS